MKSNNLELFKKSRKYYGGELRKKADHRGARPLVFRSGSIHITLRSLKAQGVHSFQHTSKRERVRQFVESFSKKKGVQILSFANVGNHLHLHVKLFNKTLYKAWIRGLSSGLAMIAMGLEGLKQLSQKKEKFWYQRPFSRIIQSFKHFQATRKYVEVNILEGMGISRIEAELIVFGSSRFFRSG
jgi:REP element-mobilizing transposase RayT